MLRKILFFSLVLLLTGGTLITIRFSTPVLASPVAVDKSIENQILEATVRMTLYAPLADAQDNPQYVEEDGQQVMQLAVNEGLGTLVRRGNEILVITHDHWLLLTPELRRVQFHNVANELLLEISGDLFLELIRYRDSGTMVLSAPEELSRGQNAVPLGDSSSTGRQDVVYLVHRQSHNGRIGVAAMLVQKETAYKGQPVFRLTSLNGEVVLEGNSGGGVVSDGQLIGNMWGTILLEDVSGAGRRSAQQTPYSLAAQLPAAIGIQ